MNFKRGIGMHIWFYFYIVLTLFTAISCGCYATDYIKLSKFTTKFTIILFMADIAIFFFTEALKAIK
jgi:hypothetical protein